MESGKKRSRAQPLALNPNLLFEREEEEELEGGDERERIHSEVSSSNDRELDHKKMAKSFESQGNQLAEVDLFSLFTSKKKFYRIIFVCVDNFRISVGCILGGKMRNLYFCVVGREVQ